MVKFRKDGLFLFYVYPVEAIKIFNNFLKLFKGFTRHKAQGPRFKAQGKAISFIGSIRLIGSIGSFRYSSIFYPLTSDF